jgi:hypothetical protein
MNRVFASLSIGFIFLAVGAFLLLYDAPKKSPSPEGEAVWATYTNHAYDFEISHPAHWIVAEFPDNEIAPMFNIYKPGQAVGTEPLDHFASVTHVSIYPRGIPTEGVFGERRESAAQFGEEVAQTHDFLLEGGEVWATYATFENFPSRWDAPGFVWAHVAIQDLEVVCMSGAEVVSDEACDPLFGDQIVRRGTISKADRTIEERMLASFKFLDE